MEQKGRGELGKEKGAGKILMLFYEEHQSWGRTRKKAKAKTEWNIDRIDNAIDYLCELKLINVKEHITKFKGLGSHNNNKVVEYENTQEEINLTEKGIATVNDPQTFKSTFGFEKPQNTNTLFF